MKRTRKKATPTRSTEKKCLGAGTYNVDVTIIANNNGSNGAFQILVDGNVIGTVTVNDASAGPFTLPVNLSVGQRSVDVICMAANKGSYFGLGLSGVVVQ